MSKPLTEIEKAEVLRILKDRGQVGIAAGLRAHFQACCDQRAINPGQDCPYQHVMCEKHAGNRIPCPKCALHEVLG